MSGLGPQTEQPAQQFAPDKLEPKGAGPEKYKTNPSPTIKMRIVQNKPKEQGKEKYKTNPGPSL
jgi:hypothetical protein